MQYIVKQLITGFFIMTAMLLNPVNAGVASQDEATIVNIIQGVATLADLGDFDALEKLYADEVEVDYTSLSGGEVELKSPQALMSQWASVLPGFDATRHQLSNVEVRVDGARASATADFIADHYSGKLFWQVRGEYRYQLQKDDGAWQITHHTLNLKKEVGTRDVFGPAMAKANSHPAPYIERQRTEQAVRDFLISLEEKDMEKFASLWAEDAMQDMPFSPEGFPKRVNGRAEVIALYANWPQTSGKADFTSQLVFYPMQDPQKVFAEWRGEVDVVPTGRKYLQTYGGLFHVENGKIKLFREYYDPVPFKYAFGLDQK